MYNRLICIMGTVLCIMGTVLCYKSCHKTHETPVNTGVTENRPLLHETPVNTGVTENRPLLHPLFYKRRKNMRNCSAATPCRA